MVDWLCWVETAIQMLVKQNGFANAIVESEPQFLGNSFEVVKRNPAAAWPPRKSLSGLPKGIGATAAHTQGYIRSGTL